MFSLLNATPVAVDATVIDTVGICDPGNLEGMRIDHVGEGERLERKATASQTSSHYIEPDMATSILPKLSGGVESLANKKAFDSTLAPVFLHPTNVVRGFCSAQRCKHATVPAANAVCQPKPLPAITATRPKKPARFVFGGSLSSYEHEIGFEKDASVSPTTETTAIQVRNSLGRSEILKSMTELEPGSRADSRQEHDSSSINVRIRNIKNEAVADLDADGYLDKHAIDDDDDEERVDWEDTSEESGKSSSDKKVLRRDGFRPVLASRQSRLTRTLSHPGLPRSLGNDALQATLGDPGSLTTCYGLTDALSDGYDKGSARIKSMLNPRLESAGEEVSTSNTRLSTTDHDHVRRQAGQPPCITYQDMIKKELGESHQPNIRPAKSSTANTVDTETNDDSNVTDWNLEFIKYCFADYHTRGW
ncbi:hypothetical protein FSARC_588 [Fusarium sarcochroum]|uniref:DUF3295 domain-containing protein n=1 Tax=Fusarium sarcochroum TaxID=1208366 RepID=A0A8H4UAS7_9HYPO|nr:hypothetical protein FSARC_588 [Fusarium sarcochroum]